MMETKRIAQSRSRAVVAALVLGLIAVCPAGAGAQGNDWETRVIEIEHANEDRLAEILGLFPSSYTFDAQLKTLLVRAPRDVMPAIEQVLARFDVPQPRPVNIELTTHVLLASRAGVEGDLPEELREVVRQLRTALAYESFALKETIIARTVEPRNIRVSGILSSFATEDDQGFYQLDGRVSLRTDPDGSRLVLINDLEFRAGSNRGNVQIETSVEIAEGQQVVVGKTSVSDSALILVMNARIVD